MSLDLKRLFLEYVGGETFINTHELMKLKKKHSIRLLPILHLIKESNNNKKNYQLDELNELFGTNYKKLTDIERYILSPAKEEIKQLKLLSFEHEINFDNLGQGRPKAVSIGITIK